MIATTTSPYTSNEVLGFPTMPRTEIDFTNGTSGSFPRTSMRVRHANPNHHLWNNNGTWYLHYTMHPTPVTKARVRVSLSTKSLTVARAKRDAFLASTGR